MEYSLNHLSQVSNLKELSFSQFVNSLNLIGLEVDGISKKTIKLNHSLENIKILLKIPANREDLLIEDFFLEEISLVFLFEIVKLWKKIKKNYNFILKQKYQEYLKFSTIFIDSELSSLVTYILEVKDFENLSSPLWVQKKLKNQGIDTVNNFNDVLSLVISEWGQNLNPFLTLDKCSDHHLFKLERLNSSEKYIDFSGKIVDLLPGTIVLKNTSNQIFVVLGILNAISSYETNNSFFLEITFYNIEENPLLINLINPKISLKYFRKMFLEKVKFSFQRLLTLIEILGYASIVPKLYCTKNKNLVLNENKFLLLKKQALKDILNINVIDEKLFEKAGLKTVCTTKTELYFKISNSRKDLTREIDLIEEYSRFFGYQNFPEIIPEKKNYQSKNNSQSLIFLKEFFLHFGFNEIVTNSLEEGLLKNGFEIKINNPLNTELSILRTSLLPKLFEIFVNNLRVSSTRNNVFEIGRVFKKYKHQIIEENKAGAIFQNPLTNAFPEGSTEWFLMIGFIETLLQNFGYKDIYKEQFTQAPHFYHPKRSILLKYENKILGIFGQISPKHQDFLSLRKPTYFLELNLIHFSKYKRYSFPIIYNEYSKYPKIIKDLSCLVPKTLNFTELKKYIKESSSYLKIVNFFDIYFEKTNKEFIKIGIRCEFQSFHITLTNELVEIEMNTIKSKLVEKYVLKIND